MICDKTIIFYVSNIIKINTYHARFLIWRRFKLKCTFPGQSLLVRSKRNVFNNICNHFV